MVNMNIVKEMMEQRNFKEYKTQKDYIIGEKATHDGVCFIYIKIFNTKFELNIVREFLSSNFKIDSRGTIALKTPLAPTGLGEQSSPLRRTAPIAQLVIICNSFQNSHIKEFKEVSSNIQLIRSDFFSINITKKAPPHQKVDGSIVKNKKELPIIKEDDPNCVFYNFVKGDVIRVTRFDGDICYRLVK